MLPARIPLCFALFMIINTACDSDNSRAKGTRQLPDTEPNSQPAADSGTPVPDTDGQNLRAADPLDAPGQLEEWQHLHWLDKTSRLLRGKGLSQEEQTSLIADNRATTTLGWLNGAAFDDQVLGFNLYFLGFGRDRIRDDQGNIATSILNFPHAVAAAQAVSNDGDYHQLFEYEQPYFVPPMGTAFLPFDPDNPNSDPEASQKEIYDQLFAMIQDRVDEILIDEEAGDFDRDTFCQRIGFEEGGISLTLFLLGMPNELVTDLKLSNDWFGELDLYCFLPDWPKPELQNRFVKMKTQLPVLRRFLETYSQSNYQLGNLQEIAAIDPADLWLEPKTALTTVGFYQNLQNSSTNYNRRRGAYVLKRYFCDDLTPISIELPESHGSDQHASDPSCQACHYKLDPMAGFFKSIGFFGQDFTDADTIQFDDLGTMNLTTYQAAWQSDDPDRTWNIGYIRSPVDPDRNSYGESLPDLFQLIQSSPEVKQCLVKRMFAYFVDEAQIIDQGYLDYLVSKYSDDVETLNSAQAFKRTLARIIVSNSFATTNPNNRQCYDFAPGTVVTTGRPPCEVASVLQKNCVSCHSNANNLGGLNLEGWVTDLGGKQTFPYLAENGQRSAAEVFTLISARIATPDSSKRMPLDQHMSAQDRETLFLWLDHQLSILNQGGE